MISILLDVILYIIGGPRRMICLGPFHTSSYFGIVEFFLVVYHVGYQLFRFGVNLALIGVSYVQVHEQIRLMLAPEHVIQKSGELLLEHDGFLVNL